MSLVYNFRFKSGIPLAVQKKKMKKKKVGTATITPKLDYSDVLYMSALSHSLHGLDSLYHRVGLAALTGCLLLNTVLKKIQTTHNIERATKS